MSLTDKLTVEKAGLESYLDSERGAKLEQSQIDRLDTLNSLLGIGSGGVADTTATGTITTQNLVPTGAATADRKSTRLNSSHTSVSRMPSSA